MRKNNFKINFIGIGTIRGGSTWIHECLKEHPDICMPTKKETGFFKDSKKYKKGLDFYQNFFPNCSREQLVGEFDPGYLSNPKSAERIKKMFPNTKIIVSLRNPMERAHSHYLKHKGKGLNQINSFKDIAEKPNIYLNTGFYGKYLENYLDKFPRENILVLIHEDIEKNPVRFIQNIYKFIGVDKTFIPKSAHKKVNYLGFSKARIPVLNKTLNNKKLNKIAKKIIPKKARKYVKKTKNTIINKINMKKNTNSNSSVKKPEIEISIKKKMRRLYSGDIEKVKVITGRNLKSWK